ncbi:hypothetical protein MLD38_005875 [Melastoma candidum]|uniref:Uncharacterized protein n=1 Tax=Melastoma candidum TaxID=119954 RepID=A0ACB9RUI5_9MYRT|nr:hypothetical protein MLD38_005875 [Melastoma candidum]
MVEDHNDLSFRSMIMAKELMVLGCRNKYGKVPTFNLLRRKGPMVVAKEMVRVEGLKDYNLKNCCNGLFYFELYDRVRIQSAVFNPSTGEFLKLPEATQWLS